MTNLKWPDTKTGREGFDVLGDAGMLEWPTTSHGYTRAKLEYAGPEAGYRGRFLLLDGTWTDDVGVDAHTAACILCEAARAWLEERPGVRDVLIAYSAPKHTYNLAVMWYSSANRRRAEFEHGNLCTVLAEAVVEMSREGGQ